MKNYIVKNWEDGRRNGIEIVLDCGVVRIESENNNENCIKILAWSGESELIVNEDMTLKSKEELKFLRIKEAIESTRNFKVILEFKTGVVFFLEEINSDETFENIARYIKEDKLKKLVVLDYTKEVTLKDKLLKLSPKDMDSKFNLTYYTSLPSSKKWDIDADYQSNSLINCTLKDVLKINSLINTDSSCIYISDYNDSVYVAEF